jgi:hypothetical protein
MGISPMACALSRPYPGRILIPSFAGRAPARERDPLDRLAYTRDNNTFLTITYAGPRLLPCGGRISGDARWPCRRDR